jgi:hypothetical protein
MICSCSSFPLEEKPISNQSESLTLTEKTAIKKQIEKYFITPKDLEDSGKHKIRVHLFIDKNGIIKKVDIDSANCYNNNIKVCEILTKTVLKAIHNSSPLKNLTEDRYEVWKEVFLDFYA